MSLNARPLQFEPGKFFLATDDASVPIRMRPGGRRLKRLQIESTEAAAAAPPAKEVLLLFRQKERE
jgi:hypothetical protein